MRKKLLLVPFILSLLLLAGCSFGFSKDTDNQNDNSTNESEELEENEPVANEEHNAYEEGLSVAEILTKTYEAMHEMESFSLEASVLLEEWIGEKLREDVRVVTLDAFTEAPYDQYATIRMFGM